MPLTRDQRKQLLDLLQPHMGTDTRRAHVENALYDRPVLKLIEWNGNDYAFTSALLTKLDKHGDRDDIIQLLETVRGFDGSDKQADYDAAVAALKTGELPARQRPVSSEPQPEIRSEPVQAAPQQSQQQSNGRWRWIIGAVLIPLLAAVVGAVIGISPNLITSLSSGSTRTPTSTATTSSAQLTATAIIQGATETALAAGKSTDVAASDPTATATTTMTDTRTPTATPTESTTPTSTPTQTATPGPNNDFTRDDIARTYDDNNPPPFWVRFTPGSDTVVDEIALGDIVVITGSAVFDSNQWWWPVITAAGEAGWLEDSSLQPDD